MLDWSMVDLAVAASLSVSTVKRVERDPSQSVSDEAHLMLRHALERAGVDFLDEAGQGIGVRLKAR